MFSFQRRNVLRAGAAASLAGLSPLAFSQGKEPIRIGILIPLTGATSQFGATMSLAAKAAAEEINAAGGVNGRKVEVVIEDDQSNPEAAVRAARKLIDIDKCVSIGGSYASAVTSAIAPLCWEGKVVLETSSGADSITRLPHQGYVFRTSPTTSLQGTRVGDFAVELGAKRMFFMGPQAPFAQSYIDTISAIVAKSGGTGSGLIYEDKKASYRSEVDQALRFKPDVIVFGGYVPDTAVVLKDLYRAGYDGRRIGLSFGVNQKLIEAVPAEVCEGTYSLVPSAAEGSSAYKRLVAKLKVPGLDSYSCQVYDHVVMTALALASAPNAAPNGTTVRDHLRNVTQSAQGKLVDSPADGLKALAAGTTVNYDGASGPLEFADNGDVKGVFFRYEQAQKGALVVTKVA
ncbi:ABC transporter substrate-binding protein [Xylophilus sp. GOD-11R]|uniref:ABC transporter substrate-binding protein n=1 Tax=Xylophilus sp. GOD-11R TaxID=3089814 RepID=UPI00298C2F96|nr:ABC transporter substrate-binding protein [Xylophilus sp. GOD-11R]WPB58938.1 ABC transporter substrate-binding protein [Xylophilus sp. GOD-11R]